MSEQIKETLSKAGIEVKVLVRDDIVKIFVINQSGETCSNGG